MKLLSIDCGIKNTGYCFAEASERGFIVLDIGVIGIGSAIDWTSTDARKTNAGAREFTRVLVGFRKDLVERFGSEFRVILEQQPHINRTSCMIHDIVSSAFYEHEQLNVHPSIKGTIRYGKGKDAIDVTKCLTAKPLKELTKRVAAAVIASSEEQVQAAWKALAKKDDAADALVQALVTINDPFPSE